MTLYKNSINILTILFITLYPILPSYGLINSDIILYLLFIIQLMGFIFIKSERKFVFKNIKTLKKDKIFISLLLLNILMYLSTIIATFKKAAFVGSIRFSMYIFIYYTISYNVKSKNIYKILLSSFLGIAVFSSLISIYQFLNLKTMHVVVNSDNRISSFLENSNNLGVYSVLSIFIIIMLLLNSKKRNEKIVLSISIILLIVNIVLSQSRNALLGLLLGFVLVAIMYNKRFILYSFLLFIILLITPQSQARLFSIFDMNQNSTRIKIWELTEIMIKHKPITGLGYGNFTLRYHDYVTSNPSYLIRESYIPLHPHNIILKFQSELGILGTIFFLIFIILTLNTLYKNIKKCNNPITKSILTGIIISFIVFHFMNIIDCYYDSLKVLTSMFILLGFSNIYSKNKYLI